MSRLARTSWGLDSEPDEQWRARAACVGHDPEWWTVGKAGNARAMRICAGCPVTTECLDFGLRSGSVGVIFGGEALLTGNPGRRQRCCRHCGAQYTAAVRHQLYCTERCRKRHHAKPFGNRTRSADHVLPAREVLS